MAKLIRSDEKQFYLTQYCLELAIADYKIATSYNSCQIAAASVFLANKLLRKSPSWPGVLMEMTGFQESQLKAIAKEICLNLQQINDASNASDQNMDTQTRDVNTPCSVIGSRSLRKKFSQPRFHQVARLILS